MFPVDAFQNTIAKATAILRRLQIRFHLTGGLTTVLYGEPRMTQDIDIVVENEALGEQIDSFLALLRQSDFLHDESSIRRAVEQRGMFQLFDNREALKLDFYPRELIPGELDRSVNFEVFSGVVFPVASRVDTAGAKLVWISKGSHKSRRDLRQLFRTAASEEREQIRQLAEQLKLKLLLSEVLAEPDEIE